MRRLCDLCLVAGLLLLSVAGARGDEKGDAAGEFSRGLAAMSRGDLEQASKNFQAVLKLDPQSFEAHNNLAVILTEQGDYQGALRELNKVVELKPDYFRGRKNMAELYVRLAHDAFLQAASVAPPDQKDNLELRARFIGAPPGAGDPGTVLGGVLETSSDVRPTPAAEVAKAAPAPTPKTEAAAPPPAEVAHAPTAVPGLDVGPSQFIALTNVPAVALSDGGMRVYREISGNIQPAERIPMKLQPAKLTSPPEFYVAVPGDARIDLVPLERSGHTLTVRNATGGKADFVVEPPAFAVLQQSMQPYLSPVVVGAALTAANPQTSQARRLGVLEGFSRWTKSWQTKDLQGYLDSYVADYNPRGGPGAQKWREQRAKVFERSGDITIELSDPVILDAGETVITLARQDYRSKLQSSLGVKRLTWASTPQGWKITTEEMLSEKIQKTPG